MSYRDRPEAIAALVRDDRVHRDLYLSEELFQLERERFFANTWQYVGHASQVLAKKRSRSSWNNSSLR